MSEAVFGPVGVQVLAEYNKSVVCFENALRIESDFEAASKCRHAVLCHAKLESVLETQHRRVLIFVLIVFEFDSDIFTGIRGLMRGMATLTKVTRSY